MKTKKQQNNIMKKPFNFLEYHKEEVEQLGFWQEGYKTTLIKSVEQNYKTEILKEFTIVDIVFKDDKKFLMKWIKRFQPLTNDELKEQYGR